MDAKSKVDFIEKYFVKNDGSALDDDLQEAIANIRDAFVENEQQADFMALAKEEMDALRTKNERLKNKKHITLIQAREMALFSAERCHQRQKWIDTEAENKRYRKVIERCIKAMEGSNCLELEWLKEARKGE